MARPKRSAAAAAASSLQNKKRSRKSKKEIAARKEDDDVPTPEERRNNNHPVEAETKPKDGPAGSSRKAFDPEKADSPLVVFAHGAGANSSHEWMLRDEKLRVAFADCANGKKGAPPKAEKLVDSHMGEIKEATSRHSGHPLVLVGKSMGSRVSCMVAGREGTEAAAVVCLGYPLKGTNGTLRDQTLLELQAPVLFVQGSKDSMCPLAELEKVRKRMTLTNEVHVVEGGDHSLKISKRASGLSQTDSDQKALERISAFIAGVLKDPK